MLLGLDHLVIAVPDPEVAAVELERAVGLASTGGGRHVAWGTYNRLAWLGDTYVELLGIFDRSLTSNGAVARAAAAALDAGRTGLVSFAVATDDVRGDVARLRAAGSPIGAPETRSRSRPDGAVVTWHAAFADLGPAEPPFLIEHEPAGAEWGEEARAARAAFTHPLGGPARIDGIVLPVPDVALASAGYLRTVGLRVDPTSATAGVGEQWVRLINGRALLDPAVVEIEIVGGGGGGHHDAVRRDAVRRDVVRRDVDAVGVRWRIRG
jgi:hypothetical protein